MDMTPDRIILGTRGSELALTQTATVTDLLRVAHPGLGIQREVIQTTGDKRQDLRFAQFAEATLVDKGIFIKELEQALSERRIDAAVHSLKDLPSELAAGFALGAILPRAAVEDVLVSQRFSALDELPRGARVGTSSVRRAAQLKMLRPDVEIVEIRGNVPTRVRRVIGADRLDAVLLAAAGLQRLGLMCGEVIEIEGWQLKAIALSVDVFLPAAGQGAIAVECRQDDQAALQALAALHDPHTALRVRAEREFLRLLGAGCQTPVGLHTWIDQGVLGMRVRVFNEQDLGAEPVEGSLQGRADSPEQLAAELVSALGLKRLR